MISEREAAKRAVLVKYARLTRTGRPMECIPPKHGDDQGPRRPRIIFKSEQDAKDAAVGLQGVFRLRYPPRAYPCPRSRHGHYHLTDSDQAYLASGGATG